MNEQKVNEQNIENELQEKLAAYRSLENRLNSLANQQNAFASKIVEVQSTIESINEIRKGANDKGILFQLGSAAHTRGTVSDKNKIIVEIGAGVALEKTAEEAISILESRKKEIEEAMEVLQKDMHNMSAAMQEIENAAQEMLRMKQEEEKEEKEKNREKKFGVVSPE